MLVQMKSIPESVMLDCDFSLARINSSVAAAYFAAREAELKHRKFPVLEELADACDFSALVLRIFGLSAIFNVTNAGRIVYTRVHFARPGGSTTV